ncbi:Signal transducer regulating beta-lactamase production, contains metallopeptidase domain [Sporobacter termitidis DSM 10068]|uniref:Signal transducer regulating beta-lactamase production, contains metallopeptidase domain n=1 Tax=Sporobacter termitidis DSM 10068 TaxID=1123282 RepID=A0A1M5Z6P0_9FIRM|nr:M56 family metallopeptidase [Sporobacter termitidis]SHI19880.1 Signal transducer regulating beta-lactamase production, contains metallopeptidase domain [Sporobacter termitidis DSM 10068]
MSEVFKLVLSLSLSGSGLILLLLALRPLFRNKLSKTWQYYLWLIVLLRLIVPYSPSFGLTGIFTETAGSAAEARQIAPVEAFSAPAKAGGQALPEAGAAPPAQAAASPDIFQFLGVVWLSGAVLAFAVKSIQYAVFTRKIRKGARPAADAGVLDIFEKTAASLGLGKIAAPLVSARISTPMLVGLLRPAVLLPEAALSAGRAALPYVFRHELTHLKRRDIVYKWFAEVILCVHWFNPLAYLMTGYIAEACELSCDEAVAARLGDNERRAYGNALLDTAAQASGRRHLLMMTLREDKISMKERLRTIMKAGKKSRRTVIASSALALSLCLAAVLLGACSAGGTTVGGPPPQESSASPDTSPSPSGDATDAMGQNIVYKNTDYGFDFTLPKDWQDYTIVSQQWSGWDIGNTSNILATGPQLLIRSPQWTAAKPTQDIPIMIFTLTQWEDLQQEKFVVSAAPVPPSELGRNSKYVFALPARYNFAYPPGYEEVEQIMNGEPLTPTEDISVLPDTPAASSSTPTPAIVYKNTQYGFNFDLPAEWKGYKIVSEEWKGTPLTDQQAATTGPQLLIRNPKWTKDTPTQDIPIMVFTMKQWDDVQEGNIAVSAAPILPSELGRNSKYVFALPPRYNYAFPAGYEEVDQLLQGKPLHANESFK